MIEATVDNGPPQPPDGFELISELGRGSSAVVWLARYELTGSEVALKVWRLPLSDEHERQRFVNECRWHRELSGHPNIVGWVWASSPDDGTPWIATVPHGESVKVRLDRDGPLPVTTALTLGLDLLDGLAAIHRKGLVHRDIKLSNVLFDGDRGALCDLGIATPVEDVTSEWLAGTAGYLAPELDRADEASQAPDFASDVYSAGVTISRLLGDRAPHPIDHLVNAVATSSRRADRPKDAAQFATRLRAVMRESGLAAEGEHGRGMGLVRVSASRRRHRLTPRTLITAAVVLVAIVIGAWVIVQRSSDDVGVAEQALQSMPDIGAGDVPLTRDSRLSGRCEGNPTPDSSHNYEVDGQVVAIVEIRFDVRGQACGKLEKTVASGLFQQESFLALSLCNAQGQCDHDWNRYRIDAGPVRVAATDGCVVWRASAMDISEQNWLLKDETASAGCD